MVFRQSVEIYFIQLENESNGEEKCTDKLILPSSPQYEESYHQHSEELIHNNQE
jgi:hypothetical protein